MARVDGFFLLFQGRPRFCLLHSPDRSVNDRAMGAVVYVHPFAEEMNKTRRMAALQARALATEGWFVLQIDLLGCGDSDGEFGEATWSRWVDDVIDAAAWLHNRCGIAPMLWGLRAGCLIAGEAARRIRPSPEFLFWQPVHSGKQFLQQFLRVKLANQLVLGDNPERLRADDLRRQLASGESVEIAGYMLSPGLALGMDASELLPSPVPTRVAWFEVGDTLELTPAVTSRCQAWQAAGTEVQIRGISGPPFWQTQELAECPELIRATVAALAGWQK